MKKSLISILMIVVMLVAFAVPALAADGNAVVRDKLVALKATFGDSPTAVKAIDDALVWLTRNPGAIDLEQADDIIDNIDDAIAAADGVYVFANLTPTQLANVEAAIKAGADVIGATVSFGANNTVTVRDADGNTIFYVRAGGAIQQTGIDASLLVTIIIGITVLFGAAAIVAVVTRKKRLANEAA